MQELVNKFLVIWLFSGLSVGILTYIFYILELKIKFSFSKCITVMLILSLIHVSFKLLSNLLSPIFYILFASLILCFIYKTNLFRNTFVIFKLLIITLVIEVLSAMLVFNLIFKIDIAKSSISFSNQLIWIPVYITELITIILIKRRNLTWVFGFIQEKNQRKKMSK